MEKYLKDEPRPRATSNLKKNVSLASSASSSPSSTSPLSSTSSDLLLDDPLPSTNPWDLFDSTQHSSNSTLDSLFDVKTEPSDMEDTDSEDRLSLDDLNLWETQPLNERLDIHSFKQELLLTPHYDPESALKLVAGSRPGQTTVQTITPPSSPESNNNNNNHVNHINHGYNHNNPQIQSANTRHHNSNPTVVSTNHSHSSSTIVRIKNLSDLGSTNVTSVTPRLISLTPVPLAAINVSNRNSVTAAVTTLNATTGNAQVVAGGVPKKRQRSSVTSEASSIEDENKKRTHRCSFPNCHKVYTKSSHLKAHQRTHTGEYYLLSCGRCQLEFYWLGRNQNCGTSFYIKIPFVEWNIQP